MAKASFSLLLAALLLAGCGAFEGNKTPGAVIVAPTPKTYSCAEQRQAAIEYARLQPGSMLRRFVNDYGAERAQLRALHRMPEPSCP